MFKWECPRILYGPFAQVRGRSQWCELHILRDSSAVCPWATLSTMRLRGMNGSRLAVIGFSVLALKKGLVARGRASARSHRGGWPMVTSPLAGTRACLFAVVLCVRKTWPSWLSPPPGIVFLVAHCASTMEMDTECEQVKLPASHCENL